MIARLEHVLAETGHAHNLARDMLTPVVYNVDVRIILDNSGSMSLDMLGRIPTGGCGIDNKTSPDNNFVQQTLNSLPVPFSASGRARFLRPPQGGLSPFHRRWYHARDLLRHWATVYGILGLDPYVYLLNRQPGWGTKCRLSIMESIFALPPQGGTPMPQALMSAIQDHAQECNETTLLLLGLTDGEANDMVYFNRVLDEIQNLLYGDVQICLLGLSLIRKDIEWFENEECDETRVRTIEAFEVEDRQIQLREVAPKEGGYNYAMHTYRGLVTNFFPADYDYEAPLQNFRHRVYITIHGRDRWWAIQNNIYWCVCSQLFCSACFLATGCHGFGWCQGNECGKCQCPDMLRGDE